MTILVTGSTGTIGSRLVARLATAGATVHALARNPERSRFPAGVRAVKADLTDLDATRSALSGVSTLFLINAVAMDELSQAMNTLNLAIDSGIRRIVYLSVISSERFTNVPHFAGKYAVERMIEQLDLPATVLRPNYFMQNDLHLRDAISGGVYPMPIGNTGISMVDVGDIVEIAARELLRRERADQSLPRESIDLTGPDPLTGEAVAGIWTGALGRTVQYAGDDLNAFESAVRNRSPAWMAYDLRLMMQRFQQQGAVAKPGNASRLEALLGRPLRSYQAFAVETASHWGQHPASESSGVSNQTGVNS